MNVATPNGFQKPSSEFIKIANQAASLYQQGKFQAALSLSEELMTAFPHSAPLLHLAASAAWKLGALVKAEAYCLSAIAGDPGFVLAFNTLGLVLKLAGRYRESEASFRQALSMNPSDADIWVNLGNLLRTTGQAKAAEAAYTKALAVAPNHVDALYNFGLLLMTLERWAEAESAFKASLRVQPSQPDVYNELGNLFADRLRLVEAENAYRNALALRPKYADAYFNLGVLLKDTRRHSEALACIQQAIALDPAHAEAALNCLGSLFIDAGRDEEAEVAYRRALAANPDFAAAYNNLGNLLMKGDRLQEAETAFRKAVFIRPDYGYALGQAVTCARRRYSWCTQQEDERTVINALNEGMEGIPALMVLSLSGTNPELHRKAAELAAIKALKPYLDLSPLVDPGLHRRHGRLRIGYLSADFREHAVMHLMAGVLNYHNRNKVEVYGYSYGPNTQDGYRKRIEDVCEHFHDLRKMDYLAAARRIADDEIDILVDLNGHTGDARPAITAMRPAPVIVSWLGFPGTLGIPLLADYIIGDSILTPLKFADHYSETLAWMPHCYQPNDDAQEVGERPTRREVGLPDDALVFCSFNQGYKLTPETFNVWCRLLVEVEGSVLWLLEPKDKEAAENLRKEANLRGIDPDRLFWASHVPMREHLARLQLADVALDSFPYGSGATGSNVLRAGVPLVTLIGDTYVSRMAASQLHAMGLPELVTRSWEEYLQLAKRLATEPEMRRAIRDKLAEQRETSPLFDTPRFTRDLEALYDKIWDQHACGIREPITS